MKSLERLSPKALMRMRTSPDLRVGIGRCLSLRTSGPPAEWITTAFIVDIVVLIVRWGVWISLLIMVFRVGRGRVYIVVMWRH